jgi:PAS domain S-box-containing protein
MINGRYRALAVVRDITERKRAEAALRESENRFRQIFEQNEDPAFLLDPHSLAIFDTNSAAVQLYGYSREKLLASGLDLLLDTSELTSRDRTQAEDRATESSDVDWNTVSPIHTRDADGKAVIASLRGKVIHSQGRPCLYCTLRDITEKLRIRKERNALQAKLLQANKMTAIGTLASGIAHEINNPNNYILSNAQFLTDMWQDLKVVLREYAAEYGDFSLGGLPYREAVDDLPRLIEGMAEGAHRIKNIVTNLKDFARQDETTRHRPIDLNKAIEAALVILANKIKRHTVHFFRNLAPDLPPVMGNFQKIEQVIINLVINALQSLPGKHLGVYLSTTCETATGRVLITVRDQGEGMPEDIRNRILEPFFTTRQKIGGTGLGLSICYAIVSEHHGTLDFQSEPGRGTTVTLMLPAGNLRRQAVEKPLARPTDEHT